MCNQYLWRTLSILEEKRRKLIPIKLWTMNKEHPKCKIPLGVVQKRKKITIFHSRIMGRNILIISVPGWMRSTITSHIKMLIVNLMSWQTNFHPTTTYGCKPSTYLVRGEWGGILPIIPHHTWRISLGWNTQYFSWLECITMIIMIVVLPHHNPWSLLNLLVFSISINHFLSLF